MWPDKESNIDYLNFGYLVDMVADIATNRELSPSTIGLYGDWGSGKSSLMKLARQKIEEQDKSVKRGKEDGDQLKTLCIEFNGWLFEGYEDAKTSLCGAIFDALADETRFGPKVVDRAKEFLEKIDFKKILGKGVKFGLDYLLTGGVGALTDLTLSSVLNSLKDSAGRIESKQIEELLAKLKADEKTRTEIKNFRKEFGELLKDSKVENLVVFIDELDRCSPDTILEIFEAMRLFLFVEGTSFVIGADQRRMLDVIDGYIVPRTGTIFLTPQSKCGNAPFYSSEKIVGTWHVKTLWFNMAIMLLMCIIVGILLFCDWPGRLLRKDNP